MLLKTMNSIINFKNEIPNNFLSLVELIEDDVMSNIDENTIKCNISVMIAMLDKYDNTEEEINEIDNPNNLIKRKKKNEPMLERSYGNFYYRLYCWIFLWRYRMCYRWSSINGRKCLLYNRIWISINSILLSSHIITLYSNQSNAIFC